MSCILQSISEIATARTGFAREWLVYGAMARPLGVAEDGVEPYCLYNVHPSRPHHGEAGTMRVDALIQAAWRSPDGSIGFLFVNLLPDEEQHLTLDVNPGRYGVTDGARYSLARATVDTTDDLGQYIGPANVSLTLPPRRMIAVELTVNGNEAT